MLKFQSRLLCVTALVATTSGVSILAICVLSRRLRLSGGVFIFLLIVCLGLFSFLFVNIAESVFSLVGRSTTLTGRTFIWSDAWEIISLRPLTGFGFTS